ncbi:MAG TPA: hypothetical protein PLW35_04015 [Verrucomicrobiota bacterium]|nr:hypothetical protein [Verrucomicrobiota bacterium]HOK76870.1 hypothetical protein [Verrucomicrobiota bacterium]
MKSTFSSFVLLAAVLLFQGCASTPKQTAPATPDETRAYFEVLRSDFNTAKVRTLNEVMKLTPSEADKFWPVYRNYERELAAVGDRKLALVVEFMRHHNAGTLTEQNSRDLAARWLQNVQDRLDLWKKYHDRISNAVSPIRAAQFLQVENQIAIFVDLSIASEMPLVNATQK